MLRSVRCTTRHLHTTIPICAKKGKPTPKDPDRPKPVLTPKEILMNTDRRIKKAERDERMDISMSLTEVKTYHGGFTKPRMLRASNWFPGGVYIHKKKVYEQPPPEAYTPYTVYILETRYPIRFKEPGRQDVPEYYISSCRADHFTGFVKHTNTPGLTGQRKVTMDAAWWPFLDRRMTKLRPTPWWGEDEDPKKLRLEALGITDDGEQITPESIRDFFPDPNRYRNNGTKIVEATLPKTIEPHRKPQTIGEIRELYEPMLKHESFWRPLICVTVATRPLANTLLRLCKALPRGLAFYASIDNEDRKTALSFPARMRLLRLQRMRSLTIEMARRLEGYQGGFIGIRFNHEDRGRAIRGERLGEPLPDPLRIIRVGVAQWHDYEQERELWETEAADAGVELNISPMDEWGRLLDSKGEVKPGQEAMEGVEIEELREDDEGEDEDEDEESESVDDDNRMETADERRVITDENGRPIDNSVDAEPQKGAKKAATA